MQAFLRWEQPLFEIAPYFDLFILKRGGLFFVIRSPSLPAQFRRQTLVIDRLTESAIIRQVRIWRLSVSIKTFSGHVFTGFSRTRDVVGVGGIVTGTDAFEYLLAGATAVQVGTTYEKEGTGCFARIADELREVMASKGYTCLDQVRGKLKEYGA